MPEDSREERHFDREAEKRKRRNFVLLVAAFAGLAMIGGVALALWIFDRPEEQRPPPITKVELKSPAEERGFEPFERPPDPEPEEKRAPPTKGKLDNRDIARGIGRIQGALDACAVKHGAIDGTKVTVDFDVAPNGRVTEAYPRPPHKTPLGDCVAGVIRSKGKFRSTREGLGEIRRTIMLHRNGG